MTEFKKKSTELNTTKPSETTNNIADLTFPILVHSARKRFALIG